MSAFAKLKKRLPGADIDRINKQIDKQKNPYQDKDDRFWYPDVDKVGNGKAIIRFLPTPPQDIDDDRGLPWVRIFEHSFKGPTGKWYIELSRSTIGETDPIGELNNRLWNSGDEEDKATVSKQKRKTVYISNVYIVKDDLHPENEGKVKLFKYGKKIFEKIDAMINPPDEDDPSVNPYDLWEGANFKLMIKKVAGFRNYDDSKFLEVGPLNKDDSVMEAIYEQSYSLLEFLDPSKFKSYDELQKQLNRALGVNDNARVTENRTTTSSQSETTDDVDDDDSPLPDGGAVDDDDEYIRHFQKLANGD